MVRRFGGLRFGGLRYGWRLLLVVPVAWVAGCGLSAFPFALRASDGSFITVEQLDAIVNDPDLTNDEIRRQFRELGIEDEDLIDAWLNRAG